MSIYKQFLAQDIIITPFKVNKNFVFNGGDAFIDSNVGIDRLIGTNITGTFELNDPQTGQFYTSSYQRLVYNSIKTLYYSNFISSSIGDEAVRTVVDNGVILEINNNQPRFYNYLQSTLTSSRYFPTGSGAQIGVISIPSTLFGEGIQPKTFQIVSNGGDDLSDDGEGNLLYNSSTVCGAVIYSHGLITITNPTLLNSFITRNDVTMSFNSIYTIHETQYKCTIRESEFNYSYNKSLLTGSYFDTVKDFVTSSYFNPYITTVGLYNDQQQLLAIAKLAQPLPTSRTTDCNIVINIDR